MKSKSQPYYAANRRLPIQLFIVGKSGVEIFCDSGRHWCRTSRSQICVRDESFEGGRQLSGGFVTGQIWERRGVTSDSAVIQASCL